MKSYLPDVLFLAGLASLAGGLYLWYPPAAGIGVGAVLIGLSILGGLNSARRRRRD